MSMSFRPTLLALSSACLCGGLLPVQLQAQEAAHGIIGKNDWLFYRHEFVRDQPQTEVSVDLIGKITKILEANGTPVVVALAPIKARIYAEHLPASHPLTPEMKGDYDRLQERFKAAGVHTANLNAAFMNSPKRVDELPLYFRQDTHWSAPGALLAAETIRDAIQANPVLKKAHDDTPAVKHTLLWATQKFPITGDLIQQLPPNSPKFEKEPAGAFEVRKEGGGGLLGNATGGVALLGSSYTADWTHFPKSVAFALQREVPSIAVTADRGQWVGLDTYLRDDAFQVGRPKLLVWEMPERDLKAPPSMPYREARYVMDNQEWLARVAALAQRTCTASGNKATSTKADAASTTAQDGFEISLTQAATNQEYLSAKLLVNGSKAVTVELSGPDAPARKFVLDVAGDEQEHTFKTPLFTKGKGYTKVKIYPGATKGFAMKNLEMCKQPAGI